MSSRGEGEGEGSSSNVGFGLSFRGVPAGLGYRPWALDFTPSQNGLPDFPAETSITLGDLTKYRYREDQWDPPLRAVSAAAEFCNKREDWYKIDKVSPHAGGDSVADLANKWRTNQNSVVGEINALKQLMADDRARYMPEILAQINGAPGYFVSLLGLNSSRQPWTSALITYSLRIGEFVAIHFKRKYRRVRPSTVCPGLLPPFGPPAHPAFPSAHSLQSHIVALLLLRIPQIQDRFGPLPTPDQLGDKAYIYDQRNGYELLWLAARIAKNRERAGLHYESDSHAGKLLAVNVVQMLVTAYSTDVGKYGGLTQQQKDDFDANMKFEDDLVKATKAPYNFERPGFFWLMSNAMREWVYPANPPDLPLYPEP